MSNSTVNVHLYTCFVARAVINIRCHTVLQLYTCFGFVSLTQVVSVLCQTALSTSSLHMFCSLSCDIRCTLYYSCTGFGFVSLHRLSLFSVKQHCQRHLKSVTHCSSVHMFCLSCDIRCTLYYSCTGFGFVSLTQVVSVLCQTALSTSSLHMFYSLSCVIRCTLQLYRFRLCVINTGCLCSLSNSTVNVISTHVL